MRLAEETVRKRPDMFPKEWYVDVLDNARIKIQIRNITLWFCDASFIKFANMIGTAKHKLVRLRIEQNRNASATMVSVDKIKYEDGHGIAPDKEHRDGIDKVKALILRGVKMMPILVRQTPNGFQRLDGYKRYMAFKELGYKQINCYIDNEAPFGGQSGVPWASYEEEL